jgi:two-component system LytT family response regulator
MPHRSGFEVIRAVGVEQMPPVIFVTAYDAYALQAFEVHALDYLLKPFEPERFHEALDRVLTLLQKQNRTDLDARVQQLLDDLEPAPEPIQRLMIKTHQRIQFVRAEDIDWIEAAGNYVKLHVGSQTHLLRQTMTTLETRLDPTRFLRIHRSTIVNLDRVKDLKALLNGEYEVRLHDGTRLTLSRGYRQVLEQFG